MEISRLKMDDFIGQILIPTEKVFLFDIGIFLNHFGATLMICWISSVLFFGTKDLSPGFGAQENVKIVNKLKIMIFFINILKKNFIYYTIKIWLVSSIDL